MTAWFCRLTLLAAVVAPCAGCCCEGKMPWPCGRMWFGPQCGPRFCHEWFSHPPDCEDPCSCCGQHYTGPHSLYVQGGVADRHHPGEGMMGPAVYGSELVPTPAVEVVPSPAATSSTFYNEVGELVSYETFGPPPKAQFEAPPREASFGPAAEAASVGAPTKPVGRREFSTPRERQPLRR